jgi:tetratricopeptide (TPR) repeat protein
VSLSAFNVLGGVTPKVITVGNNRRTGFIMTLGVISVIIASVTVLYFAGRHYSSVYTFNQSVISMQQGKNIEDLEKQVENAYRLSTSDVFARRIAEYQLARMNSLVAVPAPTEEQQKQFESISVLGVNAAQQAVQIDALEPQNWSVLGGIYGVLASVGVEGAKERAIEALSKSRELNPKNPLPYLEIAIVEARSGNFEGSRAEIEKAIALKPNYTEAFYLLSQLDIASGNVPAAIKSSQAMISLEPQNPARYYQLGVLYSAQKEIDLAIPAFEQAIVVDQNYANARYLLALAYDEKGRGDDAKKQLEAVLALNPGNAEVMNLIKVLNENGSLSSLRQNASKTVVEAEPVTTDNGTVSTTQSLDTNLVQPVNTLPDTGTGETEVQ